MGLDTDPREGGWGGRPVGAVRKSRANGRGREVTSGGGMVTPSVAVEARRRPEAVLNREVALPP